MLLPPDLTWSSERLRPSQAGDRPASGDRESLGVVATSASCPIASDGIGCWPAAGSCARCSPSGCGGTGVASPGSAYGVGNPVAGLRSGARRLRQWPWGPNGDIDVGFRRVGGCASQLGHEPLLMVSALHGLGRHPFALRRLRHFRPHYSKRPGSTRESQMTIDEELAGS